MRNNNFFKPKESWVTDAVKFQLENMIKDGHSVDEMAKHFSKSVFMVEGAIARHTMGLNHLRKQSGVIIKRQKKATKIDWQPLLSKVKCLLKKGLTQQQIADEFKCSQGTVGSMMREYGLSRKKY